MGSLGSSRGGRGRRQWRKHRAVGGGDDEIDSVGCKLPGLRYLVRRTTETRRSFGWRREGPRWPRTPANRRQPRWQLGLGLGFRFREEREHGRKRGDEHGREGARGLHPCIQKVGGGGHLLTGIDDVGAHTQVLACLVEETKCFLPITPWKFLKSCREALGAILIEI